MKNLFTEKDIQAGLYIVRETSPKGSKDLSFKCTVAFKIGWDAKADGGDYGFISIFTDGMYCGVAKNKAEMAAYLNEDQHGYRPLTKAEFIELINSTEQGFY